MEKKNYCSLDIETTGFDPGKDEILEIGFAFFEMGGNGFKITEEYSQVFKPARPVPEVILGLTGISHKELENAESFSVYREEIQNKLKDACIVGHNILFDIKFLQGFGIEFKGETIDTLDLAQFILPTHHSYNLENLMHYFGVPHKEAHRALADSKAVIKILQDLLIVYASFPPALREEIGLLVKDVKLAWKDFLVTPLKFKAGVLQSKPKESIGAPLPTLKLKPKIVYNFPLGCDFLPELTASLKKMPGKAILVLPGLSQVMSVWQKKILEPTLTSEQVFNEAAFSVLKHKFHKTVDELKFILKILVWQHTNWQNQNICDLNLSFFGGQFRQLIVGKKIYEKPEVKLIACDLASYLNFMEKGWYKNRTAVLVGLVELEKCLSENIGEKISWSYANFLFKSIYNPETGSGKSEMTQAVEAGLVASDLFFGLVSALLQTNPPGFVQVKFNEENLPAEKIARIKAAAENFSTKLEKLNLDLKSEDINLFLQKLNRFFEPTANRVKWLELSKVSCSFYSSPIDIKPMVKKVLEYNSKVIFGDCLPKERVVDFFVKRLGLEGFSHEQISFSRSSQLPDLFSLLSAKKRKVMLEIEAKNFSEDQLLGFCNKRDLPAALLFGSALQVKEFYYKNYESLQAQGFVLSQTTASGSRILRNFSIHEHALLLATDKFILRALQSSSFAPLPVKVLLLCHIPFDQHTHPYLEAVSRQFSNPFEDFSLPKALLNLHQLLKLFYSPVLEKVVVADPKLSKAYSKVFFEYFNGIF